MLFERLKSGRRSAVAEPRPELAEADRLADAGELDRAVDFLTEANRRARDTDIERRIRQLRHEVGIRLVDEAPKDPSYVEPGGDVPAPGEQSLIPEVTPAELTPELLRASILEYGCILVRGLMDQGKALALADGIDTAFSRREEAVPGHGDPDGYYDEMQVEKPYRIVYRDWVEAGGGVYAVDSPRLMFDMLEALDGAGLRQIIPGYLGEKPIISAQKCTLRKAVPEVGGGWHQDGRFLGDVRSLNVWLSLSRCGDVAPSMDVIPRRLEEYAEVGGEGIDLTYQVSPQTAERVAGDTPIVRPIFDPGDALLFDHLFLHQTGSDPSMPNPRYAIESWFFGGSAFPDDYVPIAF